MTFRLVFDDLMSCKLTLFIFFSDLYLKYKYTFLSAFLLL